ncbi:MAG: chemotaxis protein [Geobacteraceae bacterium]|nr:MAG: chemotaxis protein [Geobacteraceae bacterium]
MDPHKTKLPFHYLKPGEMFLGENPTLVTTLLGSCVSITMYSQRFRVGAICHGLLPSCRGKGRCDCTESFRYVDCSIRQMMGGFHQLGIVREEIEVKVFGGSDMFSSDEKTGISIAVGTQNVEMALKVIEREGLRLLVSDVGGSRGRKIFFYTHTGEVLLKRLNETDGVAFD